MFGLRFTKPTMVSRKVLLSLNRIEILSIDRNLPLKEMLFEIGFVEKFGKINLLYDVTKLRNVGLSMVRSQTT